MTYLIYFCLTVIRKLSVDPNITADFDDSSTEEEELAPIVETPPTAKEQKANKKSKSPRRIWGKKFKVWMGRQEDNKRKLYSINQVIGYWLYFMLYLVLLHTH